MINFDKQEIKKQITLDQVFELLQDWGGDPEYTGFGILSSTICHNPLSIVVRVIYANVLGLLNMVYVRQSGRTT